MLMKKLIEVALPLDAINAASAREKSIRHGHPSTLHLWWSRKPLATTRAVLFASMVDDPSEHPEKFPTEELQNKERERLFDIIKEIVIWENSGDERIFERAHNEIKNSCGEEIPAVFDPFAGGGSIPLEAQRLGLKAIAADLNPVAVMINKAMIELPAKFKNLPPVNPDAKSFIDDKNNWRGAQGLAADVEYYGKILKARAFKKIGELYPKIDGKTVIAWLWARTVTCSNPACAHKMPLVNSFYLSKKKGKEVYLNPEIDGDKIIWQVVHGNDCKHEGTVNRNGAKCIFCGSDVKLDHIRKEGKAGRLGAEMIAIVAEGNSGRVYLAPDETHEKIADVEKPEDYPSGDLPNKALGFRVQEYGITEWHQLFTNRQLTALTTFSDLIPEIQEQVQADGGSKDYANAIAVYMAFLIDKLADFNTSFGLWNAIGEKIEHIFGRQAIPMVWNYPEANLFSNSSGCFNNMISWVEENISEIPAKKIGEVHRMNATEDNGLRDLIVSTDPPYYDNIGYADLSDFFYVWLRKNLYDIYPEVLALMQTPKKPELIATPFRFDGNKDAAKKFFEDGMIEVCKNIFKYAHDDFPVTIYYAFKQKESEEGGEASTGWETMLNAIIKSGFQITGTFPMRTERPGGLRNYNANSLASSIIIVCRKRAAENKVCSRKEFLRELKRALENSIEKLQAANIAPVDMAQSAIGPGMSVYSRYENILDAEGNVLTVRDALKIINHALDEYLNGQGESLDAATQFCTDLYTQKAFNEISFGEADVLARAKNISIDRLKEMGAVKSEKGRVRLTDRDELKLYDENKNLVLSQIRHLEKINCAWLWVQSLTEILNRGGWEDCAIALKNFSGNGETLKNLAYRLYNISEKRNRAKDGTAYNNLVTSWQDIMTRRAEILQNFVEQGTLGF